MVLEARAWNHSVGRAALRTQRLRGGRVLEAQHHSSLCLHPHMVPLLPACLFHGDGTALRSQVILDKLLPEDPHELVFMLSHLRLWGLGCGHPSGSPHSTHRSGNDLGEKDGPAVEEGRTQGWGPWAPRTETFLPSCISKHHRDFPGGPGAKTPCSQ